MAQNFKQVHLIISGRVQGVFFRSNTKNQADKLSLTGWIRNLPAGKVEVKACGPEENLKKFIEWCKEGSALAKVEEVKVEWGQPSEFFATFEIIY